MVEIAEQLERVTSWIEAERVKEREARKVYEAVAAQVNARIAEIQNHTRRLLELQGRKLSSFNGMLGKQESVQLAKQGSKQQRAAGSGGASTAGRGEIRNLADAIVGIWDIERFRESLTTEEIAEALPDTGYKTSAAPASLRSSVNQALAKLCRAGKVIRYRKDGTAIPPKDNKSRARKYMSAAYATEVPD